MKSKLNLFKYISLSVLPCPIIKIWKMYKINVLNVPLVRYNLEMSANNLVKMGNNLDYHQAKTLVMLENT